MRISTGLADIHIRLDFVGDDDTQAVAGESIRSVSGRSCNVIVTPEARRACLVHNEPVMPQYLYGDMLQLGASPTRKHMQQCLVG